MVCTEQEQLAIGPWVCLKYKLMPVTKQDKQKNGLTSAAF
jgi:hypothetical protein